MKATIDIPDEIYRRVKARSAVEGRRIREVATELFSQWLQDPGPETMQDVPLVKPERLRSYEDADSLREAYPRGYRLTGPLLPSESEVSLITAESVEIALADMDTQELVLHDRPR